MKQSGSRFITVFTSPTRTPSQLAVLSQPSLCCVPLPPNPHSQSLDRCRPAAPESEGHPSVGCGGKGVSHPYPSVALGNQPCPPPPPARLETPSFGGTEKV